MSKTGKTVRRVLLIAVGIVFLAYLLYLLFSSPLDVYDPGHVFYNYDDDTDYINPNSPYVNVGGRIYFVYKEKYTKSGVIYDFCNNIAYIEYDTGISHIVCNDKKCIHNKLNATRICELYSFDSDLRMDDEGYIYGTYTDPKTDEYTLARYNLYNRSYEELYNFRHDGGETLRSESIGYYCIKKDEDFVYFLEQIHFEKDDQTIVYSRRYDIRHNRTETLREFAPRDMPMSFDIIAGRIYCILSDGFYSYDGDYSEDSRVTVLLFQSGNFPFYTLDNIQYDGDTKDIYFIAYKNPEERFTDRAGTLCRVKATDYEDDGEGNVDRRVKQLALPSKIVDYELSSGWIYYTLYDQRYIGPIVRLVDGGEMGIVWGELGNYDNTDGNIYRIDYGEVDGDAIKGKAAYSMGNGILWDWTVIGNYIYADGVEQVNESVAGIEAGFFTSCGQVRIDIASGERIVIAPAGWTLDVSE